MQFEKAYTFLTEKLERELPSYLTYHNASHTKEVVEATRTLARSEELTPAEFQIVCTAALFHDAGFLETYNNHEEASCNIARRHLPQFDSSDEEIQ